MVYGSLLERYAIQKLIDSTQKNVNGDVKIKFLKEM